MGGKKGKATTVLKWGGGLNNERGVCIRAGVKGKNQHKDQKERRKNY